MTKRRVAVALAVAVVARLSFPVLKNLYYLYCRPGYWAHLKFARRVRQEIQRRAETVGSTVMFFPFEEKVEIAESALPDEPNRASVGLLKSLEAKITATKRTNDPFLPPFDAGIFIMNLSKTHCLIFNKFQVTRDHLLVITRLYEPQTDSLTEVDLFETYNILKIHNGFGFFNSDEKAGASQRHKHLQVVPYAHFRSHYLTRITEIVADPERNAIEIDKKNGLTFLFFPFFRTWKYSLVKFREWDPLHESAEDYKKHLFLVYQKSRQQAGVESPNASFNLIFGKDWMLFVPRRAEKYAGSVSLNSLAFLGSFVTGNPEKFEVLRNARPSDIFDEVLVAKDDDNEYSMIKD